MIDKLSGFFDENFVFATLTQQKKPVAVEYKKVQIKPFLKGDELSFQFTYVYQNKVTHENLPSLEAVAMLAKLLEEVFFQCIIHTVQNDFHLTSFGKLKIKTQPPTKAAEQNLSHNKMHDYILPENTPCDFLIHLGVMTADGKVKANKFDKFRQINKYLELVHASVDLLPKNHVVNIVDFGCGKSYLTFGLYYYLVKIKGMSVNILGLDLKDDVVKHCTQIAQELGYSGLNFLTGDIGSYTGGENVDMVVTLHACDTATDAALVQAIGWNCKVILTVPCCQHELFDKIDNPQMALLTKHGIIKERISALITDTIRGELLEACGYNVGIMEFIDMEHTPKNILIKAVKTTGYNAGAYKSYAEFAKSWNIEPYLEKELVKLEKIPTRDKK